jgi:hypothetical protein
MEDQKQADGVSFEGVGPPRKTSQSQVGSRVPKPGPLSSDVDEYLKLNRRNVNRNLLMGALQEAQVYYDELPERHQELSVTETHTIAGFQQLITRRQDAVRAMDEELEISWSDASDIFLERESECYAQKATEMKGLLTLVLEASQRLARIRVQE